jgi:hypothetical protein
VDHQHEPLPYFTRSPEKTSLYVFTCLSSGGADRRLKIGGLSSPPQTKFSSGQGSLPVPVTCRRTNFSLARAGQSLPLILLRGGELVIAFKEMSRKFLNMVAAHIEGLRHPPICLFDTLFSCQCPFKP